MLAGAELNFNSNVSASYVNDSSKSEAFSRRTSDILTLEPTFGASYRAKKLQLGLNAKYLYVDNRASGGASEVDIDQQNRFTSYDYNGNLSLIDNVLSINARGSQNYRNTIAGNALVNDELFGSQELSKTQRNSAGFSLGLVQGDWVRFTANGNYSNVKSDRQVFTDSKLDNTNYSATARLFSGDEVESVRWEFTGQYNDTNGSGLNDSIAEVYRGDIHIGLWGDFKFLITGQKETNEITSNQAEANRNFDFESYGAGLSFYRNEQRFIDVTYNKAQRTDQPDTNYLGLKFAWRVSQRTSIDGEYGRRFYGKSGRFSLSHNSRKLRNRVSYEETVTNYTRLIAGEASTGVFVCPIGVQDFSLCFQPTSIDYELQPDEEFSNLTFITPEISEASVLRKNLLINSGYTFRKLKVNVTIRDTNTSYIDGSRDQDTLTTSLNLNLKLNRRSSVAWNNTFVSFDNRANIEGFSADNDDVWTSNVSYKRTINRDLSATLAYQHTERRSPVLNRDFDSNRISLRLTYKLF